MRDLLAFSKVVHKANEKWWRDPATGEPVKQNLGTKAMLMISELAEAMEGERKNLQDDKLPHRKMGEVELADFVIRVLDVLGAEQHELDRSVFITDHFSHVYKLINQRESDGSFSPHVVEVFKNIYDVNDPAEHLLCICKLVTSFYGFSYKSDLVVMITAAEYYCEKFGYDLWAAVDEKMAYNAERADHKLENRMKEGGKKW